MTVYTRLHLDNQEEGAFVRVQDVEPILDDNKTWRNDVEQHADWGRRIASIPNVIIERWLHEELDRGNVGLRIMTDEFDALVARKLQDPDWAYLRTDKSPLVTGWMGFGS